MFLKPFMLVHELSECCAPTVLGFAPSHVEGQAATRRES